MHSSSSSSSAVAYLGIDIAKLTLELSSHPALCKRRSYPNTTAGIRALLVALAGLSTPVHIICEATGGYEHTLMQALHAASIRVSL
jgi:transposase